MSWMAKLYETYEAAAQSEDKRAILWPVSHFVKNAHVEVVIDSKGNFIKGRLKVLHGSDSPTLIPCTEASAGRSGAKIAPHPLCEEIGYCAADYPKVNPKKVEAYMAQLRSWVLSDYTHVKVKAIYQYLEKGTLWRDLAGEIEFPLKIKKADGKSQRISPEKVFVRWCVEEPGNPVSGAWIDEELIRLWTEFDKVSNKIKGFCYIRGETERTSSNHPRFLRWPGDGAKLVSSNDKAGFTFRGRFTDKKGVQAAGVSFEVTQKAHNALRWLISRQGYRNGDQVFVAWAVSGKNIPPPFEDPWVVLNLPVASTDSETSPKVSIDAVDHGIDLGQSFAEKFNAYLRGYGKRLKPNEQIVVLGLDSATPGRIGIIYYRELLASEFLDRLELWHRQFAWPQRHSIEVPGGKKGKKKTFWPVSAPAPRLIADAAYGNLLKSDNKDKLRKNLLERIMPCIVDGRPFPKDIVMSAIRRTSNRNSFEPWEWERNLGIACALYKGFYQRQPDKKRRNYAMTLEEGRNTRDYLFGRLLAIAERIEEIALYIGGEKRPTTAARLMQRFADRPSSTWRNIELALQPYMQRLQGTRAPFLTNRKKELDAVISAFQADDFINDRSLSGEFLLGYHCQRMAARKQTEDSDINDDHKEG